MKLSISIIALSILATGCASTGQLPTATGKSIRINSATETQALLNQNGVVLIGPRASEDSVRKYFMRDPAKLLSREPDPDSFKRLGAALVEKTVTVTFPDSSTEFRPNGSQRFHMRQLSALATRVQVRGRTSNEAATAESIHLATERANAAKRYILTHNMPGADISVNVMGSGDFVADNHSSAGRAQNQRVEIEFFFEGSQS